VLTLSATAAAITTVTTDVNTVLCYSATQPQVADKLNSVQGAYKRQLIADARDLRDNVRALSQHWEQSPPMQRNRKLSSSSSITGAVTASPVTAAAVTAAAVSAALHELSEAKSELAQRERKVRVCISFVAMLTASRILLIVMVMHVL
jgi:hypothetical protein